MGIFEIRSDTGYLPAENADPTIGNIPRDRRYLLVGDGRVAKHFAHYFTLEDLKFATWSRRSSHDLGSPLAGELFDQLVSESTTVLLLISDRAIEGFYQSHPSLANKEVVHFSGSLASHVIPGAHPLMTFASELYSLEMYRRIPFVVDTGSDFKKLFPQLVNPCFSIEPSEKALYHSLCVLSGNFTTMLWEKAFTEFRAQLQLPKSALIPFLQQTAQNLIDAPEGTSVLTGPLMRGDVAVMDGHLRALKNDPFSQVYAAFTAAYSNLKKHLITPALQESIRDEEQT